MPYSGLFKRTLPGLTTFRLSDGASAPKAPTHLFRDWQRTSTQTSVTATARDSKWMSGSAFHRRNQKQKRYERNCKNIHHPAPSERGTKILAFPLTLLIMDVREADFKARWIGHT